MVRDRAVPEEIPAVGRHPGVVPGGLSELRAMAVDSSQGVGVRDAVAVGTVPDDGTCYIISL